MQNEIELCLLLNLMSLCFWGAVSVAWKCNGFVSLPASRPPPPRPHQAVLALCSCIFWFMGQITFPFLWPSWTEFVGIREELQKLLSHMPMCMKQLEF